MCLPLSGLLPESALAQTLAAATGVPLAAQFEHDVERRLTLPAAEQQAYATRLQAAFDAAQVASDAPQFVVLVDRSPQVQALLLYWGAKASGWSLVGATPVSTGRPGRYEHFSTPLGVFGHVLANHDFRAEGSRNKLGFRGYGRKGLRVYDFGWIDAPRGWGDGAPGRLRLQMHATDPVSGEPRLGTPQSEGCVRIPAALNDFIDRHGVLDVDYEAAVTAGQPQWVLRKDRTPSASPGRYMIVVDSLRTERPAWSPLPPSRR